MLEQFVQVYTEAFRKLPPTALWTNDKVVRTSTIQSFIYPWIANALGMYLLCEHPTDAAYFNRSAVSRAAELGFAYPEAGDAVLCIEHENDYSKTLREMAVLTKTRASLSVLVTYLHATEQQQKAWMNKFYAPVLKDSDGIHGSLIVVLPSAEQDSIDPIATEKRWTEETLWRFFLWNETTSSFQTFG